MVDRSAVSHIRLGGVKCVVTGDRTKLYIAVNDHDAARLGVNYSEQVELNLGGSTYSLPVKGHLAIPEGVAGLPVGLRELPFVDLPAWGRIARM